MVVQRFCDRAALASLDRSVSWATKAKGGYLLVDHLQAYLFPRNRLSAAACTLRQVSPWGGLKVNVTVARYRYPCVLAFA